MEKPGTLLISLDFELMWGMFDKVPLADYGDRIAGVHEVVPKLLTLFEKYGIHATWATVGMLGFKNREELEQCLPDSKARPSYQDQSISAYHYLQTTSQLEERYHFAPALMEQICKTPGQELASHTFSHLYALEAENLEAAFRTDCRAQKELCARFNGIPTSLVFPRNQVHESALQIAEEEGITAYRGVAGHPLYQARSEARQTNLILRALRLLDHYLPLSGHQTSNVSRSQTSGFDLVNLPASRQLRPYSSWLSWLDWLRLWRVTAGMTKAAKRGEVFHLWWHPHNFGVNQEKNLAFLQKILEHYKQLEKQYGMQSVTMRECAQSLR